MARTFAVKTVFEAIDRVTAPVRVMTDSVDRMIRRANLASRTMNRTMSKTTTAAKNMAIVGGTALVSTGFALVRLSKAGAEFEDTLISASAKFPGFVRRGSETFTRLEAEAQRMGIITEFSASQAATGLDFLAMAGFTAEQAIASLSGVLDLATVAGLELGEASDIASDTLGAFNLLTKDSIQLQKNLARVNDVLAATVTSSNTSVVQFFEAMKESGAAAAAAGADIETYASAVGILAQSGIKASKAGTTMKRMFLQLSAPTGEAARTLKFLGVNVTEMVDGKRNMRDIIDIFTDLEKSLEGMGTADKQQALRNIFGLIPIAGITNILSRGTDAWREYRDQLRRSQGASEEMASTMRNSVMKHFIALTSSVEGLQIALFNLERDAIDRNINALTMWVRALIKVIKANEDLSRETLRDFLRMIRDVTIAVLTFIGAVVVLRTALLALQIVLTAVQVTMLVFKGAVWLVGAAVTAFTWLINTNLIIALRLWAITMTATLIPALTRVWALITLNPIGLIIVAIAAVVAAIIWLIANWDMVKEKLSATWDFLKEKFFDFVGFLTEKIQGFIRIASLIAKPFVEAFKSTKKFFNGAEELAKKTSLQVEIDRSLNTTGAANLSPLTSSGEGPGRPPPLSNGTSSPNQRMTDSVIQNIGQGQLEVLLKTEPGTSAQVQSNDGTLKPKVKTVPSGGS